MFVDDLMSDVLKLFVCLSVMIVLVYSRPYITARGMFRGEFFALALFATLGMMVMISANHLLTLYLGLELMTLSLYAMVALQRDSAVATEAAMKYFVLGALASGMLLYGMSMLYGATGTLEITELAQLIGEGTVIGPVLIFGLVFVVAGLGFKLGAVPFHMWVPDVYHGAPTAVTLFVSSAPKIAAFAFFMRLLAQALGADVLVAEWRQMLIVMAVLSLVIGNVTAIVQTNLKRMLAYSTISHMGFVLLGVLSGDENGFSAAMFYVVVYVLMNLGAFGMILLLSRSGFEAENLERLQGTQPAQPVVCLHDAAVHVLDGRHAADGGLLREARGAAGAADCGAISASRSLRSCSRSIGAFYYLRVVKLMYFDAPDDTAPIAPRARRESAHEPERPRGAVFRHHAGAADGAVPVFDPGFALGAGKAAPARSR